MHMLSLWEAWPIVGPWSLSPLLGGKNKQVWRAEASNGKSYVLRLTSGIHDLQRLYYEIALLEMVSRSHPPFALPLPLQSRNGDAIVPIEPETGITAYATLTEFLPGQLLKDRTDLSTVSHAAWTLAWLDQAFASLSDVPFPDGAQSLPPFGELARWHPLVQSPLAAVERLPLDRDQVRQLRHFFTTVKETVPHLYAHLPQQLLHRDYDPGNVLVDDHQVTAVLDFEFAGRDLRALDLCVALSWWPVDVLGTGREWEVIDAFGRSYVANFPLNEQELLAFPDIFRLRDATSLVYRMGCYLAGKETDARMQKRVQHSLWREAWLSTHQQKLQQYALSWRKK